MINKLTQKVKRSWSMAGMMLMICVMLSITGCVPGSGELPERLYLSKLSVNNVDIQGLGQGARVYMLNDLALDPAVWKWVPFDREVYDTENIHDNVTNNTRLTCRTSGWYLVLAYCNGYTGSSQWYLDVYLNGSSVIMEDMKLGQASEYAITRCYFVSWLSAGDYLEIKVYSSSGIDLRGAAQKVTSFGIQRIGY